MFYEHIILAKKGPLARVWLAAHWDKKITKAHVFETNIEKSVEGILQPKVKLALRTSGHLLLGVVRIYSRKAKYLLADCNEAFVKIKMAFRPGMVDLPEGHREANVNAITLPEVFHDFDTALPELNDIDIEAQFTINQSRADEITMREDYGSLSISMHDDGFGDIGFEGDTPEMVRGTIGSNIHENLMDDQNKTTINDQNDALITMNETEFSNTRLDDDGFGDEFGQPELFGDLFGEPQQTNCIAAKETIVPVPVQESDLDDINDHFNDRPLSSHSSDEEYPELNEAPRVQKRNSEVEMDDKDINENKGLDQSTLIQNEDESFALAPVDASAYKGITKAKRKRKLIVDETKNISGEEMKAQLANTSDIVTTLDLAPPTKRLMFWKETGGVEKLFSLPSRTISARALFINYQRNLISHIAQLEDFSVLGSAELLGLENIHNENDLSLVMYNKRGRKRKVDMQLPNNINMIENNTNYISAPEAIREHNNSTALSGVSLQIAQEHESIALESTLFGSLPSPAPTHEMSERCENNLNSPNDTPNISGHLPQGAELGDDFHHSELSPTGLNHGNISPNQSGIENIDSIPNLLPDHVSSLINEAEKINNITLENRSCQIATDWNDFDFPTTLVSQNTGEEQMENETDEQFEERVLNKRAAQMFYAVKSSMMTNEFLFLSQLTIKNSRKQAAQKFYSLLVLKKFRALNICQSHAYADLIIRRGPLFENPKL